jgi:hypothetical protein
MPQKSVTVNLIELDLMFLQWWLWRVVTKCSSVEAHQRLRGKYRLHLQDIKVSRASNQHDAGCKLRAASLLLLAGCLLDLLLYPEDGGDMFLWNIRGFLLDYTALIIITPWLVVRKRTIPTEIRRLLAKLVPTFADRGCRVVLPPRIS